MFDYFNRSELYNLFWCDLLPPLIHIYCVSRLQMWMDLEKVNNSRKSMCTKCFAFRFLNLVCKFSARSTISGPKTKNKEIWHIYTIKWFSQTLGKNQSQSLDTFDLNVLSPMMGMLFLTTFICILVHALIYSDCCNTFILSPNTLCEDVAKQPKNNLKGIKGRVREQNYHALQSKEDWWHHVYHHRGRNKSHFKHEFIKQEPCRNHCQHVRQNLDAFL